MDNKEMNLFDLCRLFFCWIGRCASALWHFGGRMMQLTYRKWWLVALVIAASVAAMLWYSRPTNRIYKAEAMAILNGPTASTAKEALRTIEMGVPRQICTSKATGTLLNLPDSVSAHIRQIASFYVIDCKNDSMPDFVDFKGKSDPSDTINVRSPRYLYLRIKMKHIDELPQVEAALLQYLNTQPTLVAWFEQYKASEQTRLDKNSRQVMYIDSLTQRIYLQEPTRAQAQIRWNSLIMGEEKKQMTHADLQVVLKQQQSTMLNLATCTQPVVLISPFTFSPKAINNRLLCCIIGLLAGYMLGLLAAALLENRQHIGAFLRKR